MVPLVEVAQSIQDLGSTHILDQDRGIVAGSRLASIGKCEFDGGPGYAVIASGTRAHVRIKARNGVPFVDDRVVAARGETQTFEVELVAITPVDLEPVVGPIAVQSETVACYDGLVGLAATATATTLLVIDVYAGA